MPHYLTKPEIDRYLRDRDFAGLFIQLGWDRDGLSNTPFDLELGSRRFSITRIAVKRGFVVCVCDVGAEYPGRAERRRLTAKLARHHYEHLLILCGEGKQCWSVAIRPQNRPMRAVEVEWDEKHDTQRLREKLDGILFDISEEDNLGITDVVERVGGVFMAGAERVTRRFYTAFRAQLGEFAEFIGGIGEKVSKEWYAALMLNRLMFIYFMQKKHFLDGDPDYLETRLRLTKAAYGADKFHDRFYRHFLRRLFAEGLGAPESERDPELHKLLGKVPYLNGGLFDLHAIERENKDIQIPDSAFEKLFAFFRQYNWSLDTRPSATGREINPDVIGYIFEKYINDRAAMGAYYTQEDVTGYIARNTIIPFLLHRTREKCKNAFDADNGIWRFLREHPDDYIHESVKKGCNIPDSEIPENIRRGMDESAPDLRARREHWNTKTEERFALPTEIWRETIARRRRYFALREKLAAGEIREIDDLITHNLDIERFAADALREYEGMDFVAAFYESIAGKPARKSNQTATRGISVLDPACGSGAFLFAALNILEPLYARCIERMQDFVDDDNALRASGERKGKERHEYFRAVLADIATHQNLRYWIYKTIILNNLYGVDLMKEAAEIAKLRLFLKLAAEAEYAPDKDNLGLEPLPDIDYNIRAGNSLVGFVNMAAFEEFANYDSRGQKRMDTKISDSVREEAQEVRMASARFKEARDIGGEEYRQAKRALSARLDALNEKMNGYLANQYGKDAPGEYPAWLASHQPFHWLAEFYGIIEEDGGFDVVIGNPPYVEYSKIRKKYTIGKYKTLPCGNLYAYFIESGLRLAGKSNVLGMIVPISLVGTPRTQPVRNLLESECHSMHISNFADRPGTLFSGVHQKLSICITSKSGRSNGIFTTAFQHWSGRHERLGLFDRVAYTLVNPGADGIYMKAQSLISQKVMGKIHAKSAGLGTIISTKQSERQPLFLNMRLMFWVKAFLLPQKSREFKTFYPSSKLSHEAIMAILNSSLFFWFWESISDCWHLTKRELAEFCIDEKLLSANAKNLAALGDALQNDLEKNKGFVGTVQTDYEYYHKKSKHIIDKIDAVLADHYGFTETELDYIINYDIKYRMGLQR